MNEQYDIVAQYAVNTDPEQKEAESESYRLVWSGDQLPNDEIIQAAQASALTEPTEQNRVDLETLEATGEFRIIPEKWELRHLKVVKTSENLLRQRKAEVIGIVAVEPRYESEAA